jgi:uncharacterized membrane protein YeaQ/YmgE (transglycosylase-associated protein family)
MNIAAILSWIMFGLIIGLIARLLVPGRQPMGWIMTILLGIVGSLAGGFLANLFVGAPPDGQVHPAGFLMSIVGAIVVLALYVAVARSDRSTTV